MSLWKESNESNADAPPLQDLRLCVRRRGQVDLEVAAFRVAQRDTEDNVLQEGHLVALTEAGVRLHSLRQRRLAYDVAEEECVLS